MTVEIRWRPTNNIILPRIHTGSGMLRCTWRSATHTVCPESDSDKREQGCNSAYSKDDLISLRNNIGDRKHSCSKTTLGRDHGRLAAKHLDVRFRTWWRGIQTAKGHEQKWKTWTTTHCCIETSTGLGPRYRYEVFGSNWGDDCRQMHFIDSLRPKKGAGQSPGTHI